MIWRRETVTLSREARARGHAHGVDGLQFRDWTCGEFRIGKGFGGPKNYCLLVNGREHSFHDSPDEAKEAAK